MDYQEFMNWLLQMNQSMGIPTSEEEEKNMRDQMEQIYQDHLDRVLHQSGKVNGVEVFNNGRSNTDSALIDMLTKWTEGLNGQNLREAQGNLANFLMTLNERQYNEGMLENERTYNSPVAQLYRLMQSGMSRSEALKYIQQQQGGSAIGASTMQPVSASANGEAEELARQDSILNGVISAASTFAGIASMGMSAPAAIATNSIQAAAALAAKRNARAQELSGSFNAHLYRASKLGFIDPSKTTYDDSLPIMEGITQQQSPEIYDFMHNGEFAEMNGLPGGYKIFSENYNARFGNINSLEQVHQMRAATTAANLQPKVIQQEILRSKAQIEQIFANIENTNASTDNILADTATTEATRSLLVGSLSNQNEMSRIQINKAKEELELVKIAAHRAQITAADMDDTAIARCAADLAEAQTRNDPAFKQLVCEGIIEDQKARRAFIAFNYLRKTNLQQLAENNPQLLEFHNLCEEMGLGDFLQQVIMKSPVAKGKGKEMRELIMSFGKKYTGVGGSFGTIDPLLEY